MGKRIGVLGAGNSGLALSAHLASLGYDVSLWNRSDNNILELKESKSVSTIGEIKGVFKLKVVTSNIDDVVQDNQLLFITTPAFAHRDIAIKIRNSITPSHKILLMPGRTFGCLEFISALESVGASIPHVFETETILHTCRKISQTSVDIITVKEKIYITSANSSVNVILEELDAKLKSHFIVKSNYLESTLSNVGPLLHVAPVIFSFTKIEYGEEFLYYKQGISPTVSKFIEKIEQERIKVLKYLGINHESLYLWFEKCYGIKADNLKECIRKNYYYDTIIAPKNINHRYILEDVPYGLVPLESLAIYNQIEVPTITSLITIVSSLYEIDFRSNGRIYANLKKYINE